MERLLAQVPNPSPSPALASLLARALTTSPDGAGRETSVRVAALERAGRVDELIEMLGSLAQANEPGALAPYALALLAAGRTDEACAVQLGTAGRADRSSQRATFLIPAYCAAASGDKAVGGLTSDNTA